MKASQLKSIDSDAVARELVLEPEDNRVLANLCGQFDENLRQIEQHLAVQIAVRGNMLRITGTAAAVKTVATLLERLYQHAKKEPIAAETIHLFTQEARMDADESISAQVFSQDSEIKMRRGLVKGRGQNQKHYLENMHQSDINFAIGPAGTGKTYLAVARAVEALEHGEVSRLVLVRPAVEAGEKLGFLPGDMAQKVDPYLRPLYDALYEMFGFENVEKLIERHVIEVAPLAFMRGRTLNESFVILDEAQNTTMEQMKMFLTRIGFGSKVVVTGDVTQIDLPRGTQSGLAHVMNVLNDIEGISFNSFDARDVVRHSLVQKIVTAYEEHENSGDR